jgi:formate dehydrogenase major subunit
MTNHFCDFKNSDVIMAIGSNNAENHPVTMAWVQEARAKGGKYIVVDPRFTRSAALADIYAPLRSGSDMAFYGGLMKYIIDNDLWQKEYVTNYTNATFLVNPDFAFTEADGLFSGWDEATNSYGAGDTWKYQVEAEEPWDTSAAGPYAWAKAPGVPGFTPLVNKVAKKDMTMQDPNCVWQLMKKHYARYTPELVTSVTGCPQDKLLEVYEAFAATGAAAKSGTILYAMGQTQHTYGSQNVRAMAVVQLLLGNIGIAGGGINALRGEANVQGSTDMGVLFHIMPGYMAVPVASKHPSLKAWIETETVAAGYWANKPKFFVSQLKEIYGPYATAENDYAYDMLPKLNAINHSHIGIFESINDGIVKGMMCWGQNPAVGGPNASFERSMLGKLDWLVAVDLWETETAGFWKAPGINSGDIQTEVFLLPAAAHFEKQGTVANSGRWIQWRYKAIDPPGEARDDFEILDELFHKLKELYEAEGGANPEQLTRHHKGRSGHERLHRRRRCPGQELHEAGRRRFDGMRRVDLLRLLQQQRCSFGPDQAADRLAWQGRSERTWALPGVGVLLACEPPCRVQPRIGRRRWQAVERRPDARRVGRHQVESQRRAGLRLPGGRCGWNHHADPAEQQGIHHERRGRRTALRGWHEGRSLPGALRAL